MQTLSRICAKVKRIGNTPLGEIMGRTYVILTPEQLAFVKREVESGTYKSQSEAIRSGLDYLRKAKEKPVDANKKNK
ncbi:hypothetical protein FACS1894205_5910 [Alphaproteobacteria bacterium]|nr:hypothetical protein FACS1894205_5910 [Alphaproteobacteria bacterium]